MELDVVGGLFPN